jgi:hypothetical protein
VVATPWRLALEAAQAPFNRILEVSRMSKLLIALGLILVAVGLVWMLGERLGLGRLPGDIVIEREGMRIYIPITTSIIISIALSLLLWFFNR